MSDNQLQLKDEVAFLKAELAGLRQEVTQLRTIQLRQQGQSVKSAEQTTSRRRILKKLAIAAVGATIATGVGVNQTKTASAAFLDSGDAFWGFIAHPNDGSGGPNPSDYVLPGDGKYGVIGQSEGKNATPLGYPSNVSTGLYGTSKTGYGVTAKAGGAALLLVPVGGAGAPTTGTHRAGEIYVSNEGGNTSNVYFCKTGNGTGVGTWVKLNRTINGSDGDISLPTNINFLAATVRVAATNGTVAPLNNAKLTATGANPTIGDTGTIQLTFTGAATGIPAGAKGVIGVLTNVSSTNGGNLRFWTSGAAPLAVNLNIPGAMPSLNLSASFAIPLDAAGKAYLGYGSAVGAQSGYVVDVSGYWL